MPMYDYGCKACGHEFEREQRISENPVKKCPECGKLQAKRLISKTSFVLKGGGWYNDLYASGKPDSKDTKDSGEAKSESSAESSSGSKSESKSASSSKSESKSKGEKSGAGKKDAA